MNNANLWLVVQPTVGIPLFLGAVAVGSFAVHVAVLNGTDWLSDFLSGRDLGTTAALKSNSGTAQVVFKDEKGFDGLAREATVTLSDGRTATAVFDTTKTQLLSSVASADLIKK